jgi:uncharacterized alpha-E superfamily protein
MLSRTASHLYWLSRYLERAENTARMLDVTQSMMLLSAPTSGDGPGGPREIGAPLQITGLISEYRAQVGEIDAASVTRFLAWNPALPSSIVNCLAAARENARAVRGAITTEMWESINATWLELGRWQGASPGGSIAAEFFDWVKERSHLFRGVTFGTIRRDQAYSFIRLGTFLERADNTARILDARYYHHYAAEDEDEGGREDRDVQTQGAADGEFHPREHYAWSALLRSVSSLEAYRDTYRDMIDGRRVAELLIFNDKMPRSLRFCFDELDRILRQLPPDTGRIARRIAAELHAELQFGSIDEALDAGLHRYLKSFINRSLGLGKAVQEAYLETQD